MHDTTKSIDLPRTEGNGKIDIKVLRQSLSPPVKFWMYAVSTAALAQPLLRKVPPVAPSSTLFLLLLQHVILYNVHRCVNR